MKETSPAGTIILVTSTLSKGAGGGGGRGTERRGVERGAALEQEPAGSVHI